MTPQEEAEKMFIQHDPDNDIESMVVRKQRKAFVDGYNRAKREFDEKIKELEEDNKRLEYFKGEKEKEIDTNRVMIAVAESEEELIEKYESKINELEESLKGFTGQWLSDQARIKELESLLADKEEWISVKKRFPVIESDGTSEQVMIIDDDGNIDLSHYNSRGDWDYNYEYEMQVTHWRPLPKPPKSK